MGEGSLLLRKIGRNKSSQRSSGLLIFKLVWNRLICYLLVYEMQNWYKGDEVFGFKKVLN